MKQYKVLFFDLDGTLWDLYKNSREALSELFEKYAHHGLSGLDFEKFLQRYWHHNDQVWALYRVGKMEKNVLRVIRFERAFADVNFLPSAEFIESFASDFLDICPKKPHLVDGAREVLDYCKDKYEMHIITNGFQEVQGFKMAAGNLNHYFSSVINSEDCGVRKPNPGIFQFACDRAKCLPHEALMIGDDWEADILGARDFGMDQAFLVNDESRHNYKPTFALNQLYELIKTL